MPRFDAQIDTSRIPIIGVIAEPRANDAAAVNPVNGLFYYDTTLHKIKVRVNGAWVELGAAGAGGPPSGSASGDLTGTYPGPSIGAAKVMSSHIAAGQIFTAHMVDANTTMVKLAADTKDQAAGTSSLRQIGTGALHAMAGDKTLATIAAPTGAVSLNSQKITTLANGTGPNDAVNLSQLEAVSAGLDIKPSVRIASTANLSLISLTAVDGVTPIAGDRVLVKDQSTPAANGIYAAAVGAWTRVLDMDAWTEVPGAFCFVEEGTANADTGWVTTANAGGTLGTTAMPWTKFTAAASTSYTAGAGLTLSVADFSVNVDGTTLEIPADTLQVKSGGITGTHLAVGAVDLATTDVTGTLALAKGGTGGTDAATARTSLVASGKYGGNSPALTAGTWSASIAHNLGNTDVDVAFKDVGTTEGVFLDWKVIDSNNVQIRADISRAASYYRVTVTG